MLEEAESPELVMQECLNLLKQISEQRLRIDDKTKKISILAQDSAKGLQIAEHAWRWSCARYVELPARVGLCCVAGSGAPSVLIGWKEEVVRNIKSRAGWYLPGSHDGCHDPSELGLSSFSSTPTLSRRVGVCRNSVSIELPPYHDYR